MRHRLARVDVHLVRAVESLRGGGRDFAHPIRREVEPGLVEIDAGGALALTIRNARDEPVARTALNPAFCRERDAT